MSKTFVRHIQIWRDSHMMFILSYALEVLSFKQRSKQYNLFQNWPWRNGFLIESYYCEILHADNCAPADFNNQQTHFIPIIPSVVERLTCGDMTKAFDMIVYTQTVTSSFSAAKNNFTVINDGLWTLQVKKTIFLHLYFCTLLHVF